MLEMLINPRKAERKPWEMFFIGLIYASIAILLVNWIFPGDKHTGWILVTFTVMLTLPFVYYTIKLEEKKDFYTEGYFRLLKEHSHAIYAFMWLFLGFVVAFSIWYIILPNGPLIFNAQIETYCKINKPGSFDNCVTEFTKGSIIKTTGHITSQERVFMIFANNVYVLIFAFIFSLIFGAGAIFVLAWNASVIAAAIGIFTKSKLADLPLGLARYMIHGLPEIAAYFVAALAGGIISVAVIKHEFGSEKFWKVMQDSLNLVIVAVIILFLSALVEVFITPKLF